MTTRDFGFDPRNNFREEWSKMTTEQKIEFMDKRVEAMGNHEHGMGGGFGFGPGGFGGGFGGDFRSHLIEKWSKMTTEEKIEFIDKKVEVMSNLGHGMGRFFGFGRGGFGGGHGGHGGDFRMHLMEKWSKMTSEEKAAFIKEKEECMKSHGEHGHGGFGGEKGFSIESLDQFCTDWLKKSSEEKEECINKRKEAFMHRGFCREGFTGHREFA